MSHESDSEIDWAFPDSKRTPVADDYEILDELGDGQYSVVRLGKNRKTGEDVALKFVTRENTRPHEFVNEVQLMREVSGILIDDLCLFPAKVTWIPVELTLISERTSWCG